MAGDTIPLSFGHCTPNMWKEKHIFTAEDWAFWMVHIAPYVLKDQLAHPKYDKHFMNFNSILKQTIQYSFTEHELDVLEQDIIEYVKEYERCASEFFLSQLTSLFYSIYYQFSAKCLATCPLTLHALIHIPYDIRKIGPPCNNWTFVMEQWCGSLLLAIKSWKEPFTSLMLWQYQAAQLFEIVNRFNLTDLMSSRIDLDKPSCHEKRFRKSACEFFPLVSVILSQLLTST